MYVAVKFRVDIAKIFRFYFMLTLKGLIHLLDYIVTIKHFITSDF